MYPFYDIIFTYSIRPTEWYHSGIEWRETSKVGEVMDVQWSS